jgi:hypothetical protein
MKFVGAPGVKKFVTMLATYFFVIFVFLFDVISHQVRELE